MKSKLTERRQYQDPGNIKPIRTHVCNSASNNLPGTEEKCINVGRFQGQGAGLLAVALQRCVIPCTLISSAPSSCGDPSFQFPEHTYNLHSTTMLNITGILLFDCLQA